MKKLLFVLVIIILKTGLAQSPAWYPQEFWEIGGYGMCFNMETTDVNRDGKQDIIIGNWNNTFVYFGGPGILDTTKDLVYRGRCIAVCDYNGDGMEDMVNLEYTSYDSLRLDYDGNLLYYYGKSNGSYLFDTIPTFVRSLPTLYPDKDQFSLNKWNKGVNIGDLNKDGKKDMVIRAYGYPKDLFFGKLFIYMGSDTPPDTPSYSSAGYGYILWKPYEEYYGGYFTVGDFNGDGYDDLIFTSRIGKVVAPGGSTGDSLAVLHIYNGSENFTFVKDNETKKYESRIDRGYPGGIVVYGWLTPTISGMDINGEGKHDLLVSMYSKDSTTTIHYGSADGIDTIPSYKLTDPDTTRDDIKIGGICFDIGDINNDGYNDFLLTLAGIWTYSVHFGGPYINNKNPYGLRGYLNAYNSFPDKAINVGDQKGDGDKDFGMIVNAVYYTRRGYALIFNGNKYLHTSVQDNEFPAIQQEYILNQNYPNPFNPETVISYELLINSKVTLTIYDILGKEVTKLVDKEQEAGKYQIIFDAKRYASGVYICRIIAGDFVKMIKMSLLK